MSRAGSWTRRPEVSTVLPKFDIAIIGGGIIGSSTAYFLLEQSPSISLCVIEPDPTYEFASTLRASGGCRVQFTCPENIAMSLYSIDFIKAFEQTMASKGRPAPVVSSSLRTTLLTSSAMRRGSSRKVAWSICSRRGSSRPNFRR